MRIVFESILAIAAFALAACAAQAQPARSGEGIPAAVEEKGYGLDNFWMFGPNLYRSGQPAAADYPMLAKKFGVRTIVNLDARNPEPTPDPALKIAVVNAGLSEMDIAAGEDEIATALRAMHEGARRGGVLVHCQWGSDRTGAVVALYRMLYQRWSREQALNEMIAGPFAFHGPLLWFPPGRSIRGYVAQVDLARLRRGVDAAK